MTAQEFSSEFDLLYNNVSSNQAPGLTEYEKSVFLTKAQDEIIKNYFTKVQGGNKYQQGIENSNKRYADFSCLITVASIIAESNSESVTKFDSRGKIFKLSKLSKPLMLTITESFKTGQDSTNYTLYQVIPVSFEEYIRLMSKPSADPLKKQVWKLMGNSSSGNGTIEIVPHYKDANNTYNILSLRYVRQPYPIILEDLSQQGLSINGMSKPYSGTHHYSKVELITSNEQPIYAIMDTTENRLLPNTYTDEDEIAKDITALEKAEGSSECCELSKELHPEILQRAVELAKIFYTGDNQQVLTAGTRSE